MNLASASISGFNLRRLLFFLPMQWFLSCPPPWCTIHGGPTGRPANHAHNPTDSSMLVSYLLPHWYTIRRIGRPAGQTPGNLIKPRWFSNCIPSCVYNKLVYMELPSTSISRFNFFLPMKLVSFIPGCSCHCDIQYMVYQPAGRPADGARPLPHGGSNGEETACTATGSMSGDARCNAPP